MLTQPVRQQMHKQMQLGSQRPDSRVQATLSYKAVHERYCSNYCMFWTRWTGYCTSGSAQDTTENRRRHAHPVNKICRLLSRPEASSGHSSNRRAKQASRW